MHIFVDAGNSHNHNEGLLLSGHYITEYQKKISQSYWNCLTLTFVVSDSDMVPTEYDEANVFDDKGCRVWS